jgi:hypothetical protein
MRRKFVVALIVTSAAVPLAAVTTLAAAATPAAFPIEIDPELDAQFGPRPVNAVQAAEIVEQRFPGARVLEAELDERDDRPIWEIEFTLRGDEDEVEVDAVNGAILR